MKRTRSSGLPALLIPVLAAAFLFPAGCSDTQSVDEPGVPGETLSPLLRTTAQGCLRGMEWDEHTLAWLGVPYAEPPENELRWKAPRDPDPWDGVRDADTFCRPCSQLGGFLESLDPVNFGKPVGTEDCLYLNLWRPRTDEQNLPVFFYIHGGMNSVGEAATGLYHGATLSRKADVIVVTANYRLGPLGFFHHASLDTGDPLDDSGAYGLLDIIKALEWVRDNIAAFGGDPGNVTIGGESAGAFNVCSLMGSPLAAGLFHRALAMSPSGTLSTNSMEEGEASAEGMLIDLILADGDDLAETEQEARDLIARNGSAWAASYLRGRSPAELLGSSVRFSSMGLNEIGLLIQESRLADDTVIPGDFKARFERGDYNRVPFLIGSNREEYKMFLLTGILPPKLVTVDASEISGFIRAFDPDRPNLSESDFIPPESRSVYDLSGKLLGRLMFDASIDVMVSRMVPHQDVYLYSFAWNKQPAPFDFLLGAGHMTAIPFFFGNFLSDPESIFRVSWSEANRAGREALRDTMMGYWANFFRTGNPNTGGFSVPSWKPCPAGGPCPAPILLDAEPAL